MGAGGTVWIHSGSQASLSTVGLEDSSPASARSNMAPPSMIAVTVHRFNYFFGLFSGSATIIIMQGKEVGEERDVWKGRSVRSCATRRPKAQVKNGDQAIIGCCLLRINDNCWPSRKPGDNPQVGNSQNPDWDFTANLNFNGDSRQHLVVEVMEPAHILNGTKLSKTFIQRCWMRMLARTTSWAVPP